MKHERSVVVILSKNIGTCAIQTDSKNHLVREFLFVIDSDQHSCVPSKDVAFSACGGNNVEEVKEDGGVDSDPVFAEEPVWSAAR